MHAALRTYFDLRHASIVRGNSALSGALMQARCCVGGFLLSALFTPRGLLGLHLEELCQGVFIGGLRSHGASLFHKGRR